MTTFSISGNIGDDQFIADGTPNVTVALRRTSGTSTTTDANGNYIFSGLSNGTFTVTPTPPPVVFPASISNIVISGTNVPNQNFATLGAFTGTVASVVTVPTSQNTFGARPSPVIFTGTILFAPNTVVFFNNTGMVQTVQGMSVPTPVVGNIVQFDFAQVFTSTTINGAPSNPSYIGEAVNIVITR